MSAAGNGTPTSSTHADGAAAFAEAAQRVGRTLARIALERMMLKLAHIAVTGRIIR